MKLWIISVFKIDLDIYHMYIKTFCSSSTSIFLLYMLETWKRCYFICCCLCILNIFIWWCVPWLCDKYYFIDWTEQFAVVLLSLLGAARANNDKYCFICSSYSNLIYYLLNSMELAGFCMKLCIMYFFKIDLDIYQTTCI